MQIALNDEELGAIVELLYDSLPALREKVAHTGDPEERAALEHRERVLEHLKSHLMASV
ncbi:MAG: hypothetical protein HY234_01535 [Acidobacteria bacterium]|nr:hypothetical protein [Acidobacteriota bacterium]